MARKKAPARYALCVENSAYPVSLELRKVYQVIPDEKSAKHNLIRVIDESGEDYLYPESYFIPVELPQAAIHALSRAS
ncbi:MAG TPA: hypothetical protein VGZ47_19995 [Gemmataceae bacterium]|jgi:hypothetical protein|nr:hypothetical protein [Gemmataceae bacterium]